MSYTQTPKLGLYKPTINADNDQWGTHLNANADVLDGMAPLASPAFTGNPTAPTPAPGDSDTSIATTAFVANAVGAVPGGAVVSPTPPALNPGALWFDSTGGQLYVQYNDGNSTQYVTASNFTGLANAATKTDVGSALNNVGRNLIHNPLMAVAQRGVGGFTVGGNYTLDRWMLSNAGNFDTVNVLRATLADADRAGIGDEAARYGLYNAFTGSANAASNSYIDQRIEDVRRLAGKTVIVSFWAGSNGPLKLGLNMYQWFGTGGSPSTYVQVLATGVAVNVTTTWTRFSMSITLPSIAGKTLGTNGDDSTWLRFNYSCGATNNASAGNIGVQSGTITLWGVQLEIAQPGQTTPTPLEKPDPQQDLAKCQRFYQTGGYNCFNYNAAGGSGNATISLPVPLRGTPATTVAPGGNTNCAAPTLASAAPAQLVLVMTATAAGAFGSFGTFTASADL